MDCPATLVMACCTAVGPCMAMYICKKIEKNRSLSQVDNISVRLCGKHIDTVYN
jgi:hypothetical protein